MLFSAWQCVLHGVFLWVSFRHRVWRAFGRRVWVFDPMGRRGGCTHCHAWPWPYGHRPPHPPNAGTDHVGFSLTKQALLAPSMRTRGGRGVCSPVFYAYYVIKPLGTSEGAAGSYRYSGNKQWRLQKRPPCDWGILHVVVVRSEVQSKEPCGTGTTTTTTNNTTINSTG